VSVQMWQSPSLEDLGACCTVCSIGCVKGNEMSASCQHSSVWLHEGYTAYCFPGCLFNSIASALYVACATVALCTHGSLYCSPVHVHVQDEPA
jgi:hypothetical protein